MWPTMQLMGKRLPMGSNRRLTGKTELFSLANAHIACYNTPNRR